MGRAIKINISLPEEDIRELDAFVQTQGDSRSGFIRRAVQFYIEQKEKEEKEKEKREGRVRPSPKYVVDASAFVVWLENDFTLAL